MSDNSSNLSTDGGNIVSYIKKSASYSFVLKISGLLLGFIMQVVFARVLGIEEFGLYSFVATLVMFISTMTILGIDKSIIRYLPQYTENKDINLLSSFVTWSLRKIFFSILAASILLLIFEPVLALLPTPIGGILPFLMVALVVVNTPTNYIVGILLAMKKPVLSQFPLLMLKPFVIILCLIFAVFVMAIELDVADILVVNIFVSMAVLMIYVGFFFKYKKFKIKLANKEHGSKREWWMTSVGFIGISISSLIISQTDIIMIGSLHASKDVALYAVASKISGLLTFFLVSVNTVVAPLISEYYHGGKRAELIKIIDISSKIIILTTASAAFVLIFFAQYVLLIFGDEYVYAKDVLVVLCVGHCINALTGPVSYIMSMTGYQNYVVKILAVSCVINIILNWILINEYGIIGAAYATAIATIFWNLSMYLVVLKKLNINVLRIISTKRSI